MKILIAPSTFSSFDESPIKIIEDNNFEIIKNEYGKKLNHDQLLNLSKNCIGIIAGTEKYTKEVLIQMPNLKVISRLGVGMDNIDLDFAVKQKIKIYKSETSPSLAVAELTLAHILNLLRKITHSNNNLKKGKWVKSMGMLLSGKKLGIIGLGNIGKKLVKLCSGFNLEIIAYDKYRDQSFADEHNVVYKPLDDLLSQSDIISIHLNLTNETHSLIGKEKLKLVKKSAILINTSRGEILDEDSITKCVEDRLISGVGLDVFSKEPYSGPLIKFENVILTPHISAYAKEIRIKMELESSKNLIKGLLYEI